MHCIIHQQAISRQYLKFDHIIFEVINCVMKSRSIGLKRRKFRELLEGTESEFGTLLYFF